MTEKIYSRWYKAYLRYQGTAMLGRLGIRYGLDIPRLASKIKFGDFVNLDRNISIILTDTEENITTTYLIEFGSNVYINRSTIFDASTNIYVGDDVMMGPNCYITDHDHHYKGFRADKPIGELPINGSKTRIEKNVWLGANVVVLKGVTIGANSIIGAGSVVTKSIPRNSIAVGNPCKVIKERR